jgi:hypothetical protein
VDNNVSKENVASILRVEANTMTMQRRESFRSMRGDKPISGKHEWWMGTTRAKCGSCIWDSVHT